MNSTLNSSSPRTTLCNLQPLLSGIAKAANVAPMTKVSAAQSLPAANVHPFLPQPPSSACALRRAS